MSTSGPSKRSGPVLAMHRDREEATTLAGCWALSTAPVLATVTLLLVCGAFYYLWNVEFGVKPQDVVYKLWENYTFRGSIGDIVIYTAAHWILVWLVASFVVPVMSGSLLLKKQLLVMFAVAFVTNPAMFAVVKLLAMVLVRTEGDQDHYVYRLAVIFGVMVATALEVVLLSVLYLTTAAKAAAAALRTKAGTGYEPLLETTTAPDGTSYQRLRNDEPTAVTGAKTPQWRRLLGLARPELCLLFSATVALFLSSASSMVVPALLGSVIDSFAHTGSETDLHNAILMMIGAFFVQGVFTFIRAVLFYIVGERVVRDLRKDLFAAIISQEIGFFDQNRTGELINRLASDTELIETSSSVNISMALRNVVSVISGLAILLVISWKLTLIMLAVVPLVAIGAVVYGRYVRKLSKDTQAALAKATEKAEETISSIRVVRSFSHEAYECGKYSERVEEAYDLGVKSAVASGSFQGGITLAANLAVVLVLWQGGKLVISGEISTGLLMSFIVYTLYIGFALATLSSVYGDFYKALGASERVFELMDRTPLVNVEGGYRPTALNGTVDLTGVTFSYPSRPDINVLKDVTLRLEQGKVLAIVGQSGGGKSSIVNLIERFYEPQAGRITIDNIDLNSLDPAWVHSHIAMVSQEPTLFACSIRENIAYGQSNVSEERIREACRQANCDFVDTFPEKLDTIVGERGIQLSGGQKQRVAIARALLRDPKILLLDEATSALDSESEHLVQEAIDRLMKGRTTLVIAHRLSTVKDAHRIVLVQQGQIMESGTHPDLLAQDGLYAKLVRRQVEGKLADA